MDTENTEKIINTENIATIIPIRTDITDIHTHILPGVDDGARDSGIAARLLNMEKQEGVGTVVLTPHFDLMNENMEEFLEKRDNTLRHFKHRLKEMDLSPGEVPEMVPGCEMTFPESPDPMSQLSPLCFSGTNLILMELPWTDRLDYRVFKIVDFIMSNSNVKVIIAHIERYRYIKNAEIPKTLKGIGCLLQMNIGSVLSKTTAKISKKLLNAGGLIDLFGSDCHSPERRPPGWTEGLKAIDGIIGRRNTDMILRNGKKILET